ncbi:hypothetical protein M407DRAFT_8942 [Tulasnella calospora MUT 4182]|uniref:Glycoside hydrolase family 16 protein n=1 Tax=Tulasnella calospora MUT 4182 TaxID=1051891 RepID=A0A0C3QET6_9AGAM|nr:hypothetical protein M407DRAFT_8942 [Tulasnella calospora MUT 4182]
MPTRHFLNLWFAFLWSLGVTALPSQGPTRTTPPRKTFILTARAQSSSTTAPAEPVLSKPAQTAVTIRMSKRADFLTILLFAAIFGFLLAKKCGVEFHCNRAKKALARRSRGQKPAPSSPPPTVLPIEERRSGFANAPVAEVNPACGKLDGWVPPTPPKDEPRQTVTGFVNPSFGKLDGYAEEPLSQSQPPSAPPAHTESTLANPSSPPPYPQQPQSSDSWKQGTVTGGTKDGWKQHQEQLSQERQGALYKYPKTAPANILALPNIARVELLLHHIHNDTIFAFSTLVLTARAESSWTTVATKSSLSKPIQAAVGVVTVLLFVAMFGFLIAKQHGIKFHCHRVKKALGRRSRGQKPAPSSPPPTVLPMVENHGASTRAPATDINPGYAKLDGWVPPTIPKEAPRQTITGFVDPNFGKLDGYTEEPLPQSQLPSATPAYNQSTPANPPNPPLHPEQPHSSDSWKEGTVTGVTAEGWKQ